MHDRRAEWREGWPTLLGSTIGSGLVGPSQGAEGDVLAFFAARHFGQKAFGSIFGVLGLRFGLAVALRAVPAGYSFDRNGDCHAMLEVGGALSAPSAARLLASGLIDRRRGPPASAIASLPAAAAS